MQSIVRYRDLIKTIPVYNQSAKIKREVWERISYAEKVRIEAAIFGNKEEVELSREDVLSETDIPKKIVMTLMWGYPTGGRGRNIENILVALKELCQLLSPIENQNLTTAQAESLIKHFKSIRGLGISTWSKFLCFFNVSVDSRKCQIYDLKIVESLNKKQFIELGTQIWRQDINHYFQYMELISDLAKRTCALPEQVELFLFYYNLYYKF